MKIAVIGSGISGLACAHLLQHRHEVTLYERETRPGGHTHTVSVVAADGRGEQRVDTGFIVFNHRNYPNLTALFEELGVQIQRTSMSFSVSIGQGQLEWCGSEQAWRAFAQPSLLASPDHWRMIRDILRLNRHAPALLAQDRLPEGTLGEFLERHHYSRALQARYLLPMAGLIWSCSPAAARDYPVADFVRFFESHGLFTTHEQPQWFSVQGGSRDYVDRLLARFRGTLRLADPVHHIQRADGVVTVRSASGEACYDQLICATHADQALALLADASADERSALTGIPYVDNEVVLHTDVRFMPKRRAAWAAWNYHHRCDEIHDAAISGTYWMNRLQHIHGPAPYLVTLNPDRAIDPAQVLFKTHYAHPRYTPAAQRTHRSLPELQGTRGLWWCGAWVRYGFHEDGLLSALRVIARIDRNSLPQWARL